MLECNRYIHRKLTALGRLMLVLLLLTCASLLLTQVVFAQNIYVINDGDRTLVHTTGATDPAVVLEEAGLTLGAMDAYSAEIGQGIYEITVLRSKTVELICDGQRRTVHTIATDVAGLLQEQNITLGERDGADLPLTAAVVEGMCLRVCRGSVSEEPRILPLPAKTVYYYDKNLAPGEEVVLRPGRSGRVELLEQVTRLDDAVIDRVILRRTILSPAQNRIVATGSTDVPAVGTVQEHIRHILGIIAPEYDVEKGMPYIGGGLIVSTDGEVFYYADELVVKATAYNNADPGCTIYTAIGTLCRVGAIAVDPRVIPYGTRMFILTNDGKYIYGEAVAEDCGGAIKGNRIDLYFDTVEECSRFGVRQATVYFLDGFTLD